MDMEDHGSCSGYVKSKGKELQNKMDIFPSLV